jgi:hypothetical protein
MSVKLVATSEYSGEIVARRALGFARSAAHRRERQVSKFFERPLHRDAIEPRLIGQ